MRFALSTWRRATLPGRAADRALSRHSRRNRAPVVRAGLPRTRRQHAPAHLARRAHGLRAGRPALSHQSLHRSQGGLGLRGGHHCVQSTASSAGYSTGGTLISAFAAYMMINDQALSLPTMLAWVFFLSVLGVTMAIPMKRQMINVEQLRFPSGIAAAETLRALHSHGQKGMRAAKALGVAGFLAAADNFWAGGLGLLDKLLAHGFHWTTKFTNWSSGDLLDKVQV